MPKKIAIHWTAGLLNPTANDLLHYHFLINEKGEVVKGKYTPENNDNCQDGKYAPHLGGGNTGCIGVAICGMADYKGRHNRGKLQFNRKQFEACMKLCADLCLKYNIPITPKTVFTHYEFGKAHPKTSSAGKIDITFIPPYPDIKADDCGYFIRTKILWYVKRR